MKRAALLVTIIFLAIIAGLLMPWLISSIQIDDQLCDLPIIEGTKWCENKETVEACEYLCSYYNVGLNKCVDVCRGNSIDDLNIRKIPEIYKETKKYEDVVIDDEIREIIPSLECPYDCYYCSGCKRDVQEQREEERELKGVTILDEIDFEEVEPYESYKIGTAEFRIYPIIYPEDKLSEEGYFEAYNNGKNIYDSRGGDSSVYKVTDLLSFKYKTNIYILLDSWSGGAHCCHESFLFVLDNNSNLKFINILATNNITITKSNLMTRNDKLYLETYDDRFSYFYTYYAGSYFYYRFLLLDRDKILIKDSDFKDDYLLEAQRCENELLFIQKGIESNNESIIRWYDNSEVWSPLLVCKIVNYELAGEKAKAWYGFNDYFLNLPIEDRLGDKIDPEAFKSELIEKFNKEPSGFELGLHIK